MRSAVEPDVIAIAAPVHRKAARAADGKWDVDTIAVLSVVGPAYRIDDVQAAVIGGLVSSEARALSQRFAAPVHPGRVVGAGATMGSPG